MVFILHPKHFQNSKLLFKKNNIMYKLQSEMSNDSEEIQPDPIMTRIQQDTRVEDITNKESMTGSGFKVIGENLNHSKKSQNDKLRKFVSLKIK